MPDIRIYNFNKQRPVQAIDPDKVIYVIEDSPETGAMLSLLQVFFPKNVIPADKDSLISKIDSGHEIDLIFLDGDMKHMDALYTVRDIRTRQQQGEIPYIPLAIFTHSYTQEGKRAYLSTGADAYIDKKMLLTTNRTDLTNYVHDLIIQKDGPKKKDNFPAFSLDAFDPKAFGETLSLLKNELPLAIDEYLEDAAEYISRIHQGLEENDSEKVARGSHPLKSSSRSFGLVAMAQIAEAINNHAKLAMNAQTDLSPVSDMLTQLKEAFRRAHIRLCDIRRNTGY